MSRVAIETEETGTNHLIVFHSYKEERDTYGSNPRFMVRVATRCFKVRRLKIYSGLAGSGSTAGAVSTAGASAAGTGVDSAGWEGAYTYILTFLPSFHAE